MLAKFALICLAVLGTNSQLLGGWTTHDTCKSPMNTVSPFDLLFPAVDFLNESINQVYQKNVKLVYLQSQVVAGENNLAIFQQTNADGVTYIGVKTYSNLQGAIKLNGLVTGSDLKLVFAGLGISEAAVKDLNCAVAETITNYPITEAAQLIEPGQSASGKNV